MGHAEQKEGWMFSEPSWCVKNQDGVVFAVFPGASEVDAKRFAEEEAARVGDIAEKVGS